jgi:hypothetical protein
VQTVLERAEIMLAVGIVIRTEIIKGLYATQDGFDIIEGDDSARDHNTATGNVSRKMSLRSRIFSVPLMRSPM